MSPAASLRAIQDSIRAIMMIRAYRVMGHLAADLDPLGLAERKVHKELKPETYGFTDADLDRRSSSTAIWVSRRPPCGR